MRYVDYFKVKSADTKKPAQQTNTFLQYHPSSRVNVFQRKQINRKWGRKVENIKKRYLNKFSKKNIFFPKNFEINKNWRLLAKFATNFWRFSNKTRFFYIESENLFEQAWL